MAEVRHSDEVENREKFVNLRHKNAAAMQERKYPVGIQTFEKLREENYLYIDKTDLVWKMTKENPYVFLSRPRRFGKSLLCSILKCYFEGRKDLFEGLAIAELEKDWKQHPVLHFDLSACKNQPNMQEVVRALEDELKDYERIYGRDETETTPGKRFKGLIQRAHEQTGLKTVVILDEYDAPMLDYLHKPDELEQVRRIMQEFYQYIKICDKDEQFVFITGISKFSQLSIFSTINNLTNISMQPKYAAICGITEEEFATDMAPDIAMLAKEYECTPEQMHDKLKQQYDGYRFAKESPDVYNPFSLLKCFNQRNIANYWFESGTPTFLIRQMQHFRTDITTLEELNVQDFDFDQPTEAMNNALPLLYQSGYLTIKGYDRESEMYTLSIPNQEVRIGFTRGLLPAYIGLENHQVVSGFALKFWQALKKNDLDLALREMQSYFAGLPYVDGFKKKLEDISNLEAFYEWSMMLIFNMLNVYVQTQVRCAGGRADMVVKMPDTIYVIELKVNGTAQEALDQIEVNGYATPYLTDGRKIVKAGVKFSTETKTLEDWVIK